MLMGGNDKNVIKIRISKDYPSLDFIKVNKAKITKKN